MIKKNISNLIDAWEKEQQDISISDITCEVRDDEYLDIYRYLNNRRVNMYFISNVRIELKEWCIKLAELIDLKLYIKDEAYDKFDELLADEVALYTDIYDEKVDKFFYIFTYFQDELRNRLISKGIPKAVLENKVLWPGCEQCLINQK